ncbi:MAG: 2,3,4,5-tetrahydropyridine-2,6-dicarboxylate N-succinyltransferase [Deferribacteres bacterium]|nr:2,3,4,5-tetrahydropyridine-2,6-dicarboxylate N-succinyltransferase [candidate division KSB1 bacterium]MCB9503658.1 2,3,4,5-tetrahydropyridine-2,6-dicarboxylate N-succinyltransferase [Deferribacteres bacterium]
MTIEQIKIAIESQFDVKNTFTEKELIAVIEAFFARLENGEVRSAQPTAEGWLTNEWVKKGILLAFRLGRLKNYTRNPQFAFFDKDTIPTQTFEMSDEVRIVPGGTSIRRGSYVAKGVVIMPPAYVNIGAYVDAGTMIDSHALVGSCAQIGKNVHLSAAAQIGGVLEPVGAMPVIIEDNVIVGGMVGVFEGTIVKQNAVIGAGVVLTRSTPVYDCVNECILRAEKNDPLTIPENAVVVPGSRPMRGQFATENNLSVQTPLLIKYRDANTDSATALEESLR